MTMKANLIKASLPEFNHDYVEMVKRTNNYWGRSNDTIKPDLQIIVKDVRDNNNEVEYRLEDYSGWWSEDSLEAMMYVFEEEMD